MDVELFPDTSHGLWFISWNMAKAKCASGYISGYPSPLPVPPPILSCSSLINITPNINYYSVKSLSMTNYHTAMIRLLYYVHTLAQVPYLYYQLKANYNKVIVSNWCFSNGFLNSAMFNCCIHNILIPTILSYYGSAKKAIVEPLLSRQSGTNCCPYIRNVYNYSWFVFIWQFSCRKWSHLKSKR